jgi:hypothetical protein
MKKRHNRKEDIEMPASPEPKPGILNFILIEFIILSIISISLKSFIGAIGFILSYFIVYFLPGLPLFILIREKNIIEKLIIINGYGLMLIPLLYFLIGLLILPISKVLFIIIPVIVAMITYLIIKKSVLR